MVNFFFVESPRKFEVVANGCQLVSFFIYNSRPIVVEVVHFLDLRASVFGQNGAVHSFNVHDVVFVPRTRRTNPQSQRFTRCMARFTSSGVFGHRVRLSGAHVDRELPVRSAAFGVGLCFEDMVDHQRFSVGADDRYRRLTTWCQRGYSAFAVNAQHRLFPAKIATLFGDLPRNDRVVLGLAAIGSVF